MIETILIITTTIVIPVVGYLVLKFENDHKNDNFKPLY